MYFDPVYLLITLVGGALAAWAAWRVKSTFREYAEVGIASGLSGAQVAEQLLRRSNIRGVRVEPHQGFLTDHYDPRDKVVRLSPDVYHGRSVSAVGVAAHECGHVLQDADGYAPMTVRQLLVGPANFGSSIAIVAIIAGMAMHAAGLIWLGVIGFGAVVLFQLVTLPVEFNASTRARQRLVADGIVTQAEDGHVGRVLNAAALTYVVAFVTTLMQFLFFVMRALGRSDD